MFVKALLTRIALLVLAAALLLSAPVAASAAPRAHGSGQTTVASAGASTSGGVQPQTPDHWSYNFVYDIGSTTPSRARSALHSCFNCDFPVAGAPHGFPTAGQDLPLRAGPFDLGNFHCKFREEHSGSDQGGPYFGFTFDTASGHVDGPGAWIAFTFRTDRNGKNTLNVFGYVAHNTLIPEAIYKNRANAMWKKFASNIKS